MRYYLIIFLFFAMALKGQAKVNFIEVKSLDAWEEMLVLAKKSNKQVLVFVDWMNCDPCKKLRKTTFKDKELSKLIHGDFLALQVSVMSDVGNSLMNLFDTDDIPALLVMNTNEIIFQKTVGYVTADELIKKLTVAKSLADEYPSWQKGAADGSLDKLAYIKFLNIEYLNNRVTASHPIIRDVSTLLDSSDFDDQPVLSFVQDLCIDMDGPVFKTLVEKPDWITDTNHFSWVAYKRNVFNFNLNRAIQSKDSVLLEDVIYQIGTMPKGGAIYLLPLKARQVYLAELGRWRAYDTITTAYLMSLPADSADNFQAEAMHLMENYQQPTPTNIPLKYAPTNLALRYLQKGLKLKETFALYYTLSVWLYESGDLTNSYRAAYTAEKLAANKDEAILARQMQNLIEDYY